MTAKADLVRNDLKCAEFLRAHMRVDRAGNGSRQQTARQHIELRERREDVDRMAHERRFPFEEIVHRCLMRLHAEELVLALNRVANPLLQTLARRDCRDVIEHHHPLVADMPEENTL